MKILFYIKKRQNPYSKIYIRLWESKKIDLTASTGLQVKYDFWDSKNEKVKNKVEALDKDFINNTLLDLKKNINESYNIDYNKGEIININWLRYKIDVFFNRVDDSQPEKIFYTEWVKKFVATSPNKLNRGKKLSPRTILAYQTMLNHLLDYETYKNINLKHSDITLSFYWDFVGYCRDIKKLSENTIGNIIKYIKFFCGNIDFEGLPISKDYKHKEFVKPKEEIEDIYLTTREIDEIFNYDFGDNPRLDNARDLLIIGLNTGLRVSDFMRLDLSHIKNDTIKIQAQKTGKMHEIPMNWQVKQILEKRNGELPKGISDQKFNKYIKEIGQIIGFAEPTKGAKMEMIDDKGTTRKVSGIYPKYELMTSHICRRSFATNLYGQIPTPVIMAITGHSTETMFLKYIKKTASENAEILRNYYKQEERKPKKTILKVI